jgi:hypothetical protein
VPAAQLGHLRLLLVELGERELLDRELVVDLAEELHALAGELAVLGVARLLPGRQQPAVVAVAERFGAQRRDLPADLRQYPAQAVDIAREPVGIRQRDDGLLHVQRARAAQLPPHRDARPRLVRGQPVQEHDPAHESMVTRVTATRVTLEAWLQHCSPYHASRCAAWSWSGSSG